VKSLFTPKADSAKKKGAAADSTSYNRTVLASRCFGAGAGALAARFPGLFFVAAGDQARDRFVPLKNGGHSGPHFSRPGKVLRWGPRTRWSPNGKGADSALCARCAPPIITGDAPQGCASRRWSRTEGNCRRFHASDNEGGRKFKERKNRKACEGLHGDRCSTIRVK